jgi:hypothetical protein
MSKKYALVPALDAILRSMGPAGLRSALGGCRRNDTTSEAPALRAQDEPS